METGSLTAYSHSRYEDPLDSCEDRQVFPDGSPAKASLPSVAWGLNADNAHADLPTPIYPRDLPYRHQSSSPTSSQVAAALPSIDLSSV